jgi:16S rRNA (guanine(966)-N(2))-methyltransferase RsmD
MTRIIAGTHGGRRLATPEGAGTRPTSDRVREALFSSLDAADLLRGQRFLDLYAGSGAVGLEAASRGAAHVMAVESDPKAGRGLRAQRATLGRYGTVTIATGRGATPQSAGPLGPPYQVIFADPPYALSETEVRAMLRALVEGGWLAEDATVIVERSKRSPEPDWVAGITGQRARRYGETVLWYGRRS